MPAAGRRALRAGRAPDGRRRQRRDCWSVRRGGSDSAGACQDGPQRQVVTLAAGQAIEAIEAFGSARVANRHRRTGQREQFAPRQRQSRRPAALPGSAAPGAGRTHRQLARKRPAPARQRSQHSRLADAIGAGQPDDLTGCQCDERGGPRRPLPAGHQALGVQQQFAQLQACNRRAGCRRTDRPDRRPPAFRQP
jgi:hypothetical protein